MAVRPPDGLHSAGRAYWRKVCKRYDLEDHELANLRHICRLEDLLQSLSHRILSDPETAAQYRLTLEQQRRQVVALRLPVEDAPGQQRPARRPPRGPYSIDSVGV